jgi:hypothetical protein
MGTKPSGTLIYGPDGHMSVQIMRDPHPVVAASMWSSDGRDLLPSASASEIRDAYSGYYAYFGTWEIDESARTVTHHIRGERRALSDRHPARVQKVFSVADLKTHFVASK